MRKRKLSKFLAITLAVVMLAGMLPMMATANTTPFELEAGTVVGLRNVPNLEGVISDAPTVWQSGTIHRSTIQIDAQGRHEGIVIYEPAESETELFQAMREGIPFYTFYVAGTLSDTVLTFSNDIDIENVAVYPVFWGDFPAVAPHSRFRPDPATRVVIHPDDADESTILIQNLQDRDSVVVEDGYGQFAIVRVIQVAQINHIATGARGNEAATFQAPDSPTENQRAAVSITSNRSTVIRDFARGAPPPAFSGVDSHVNPGTLRIAATGLTAGRQAVVTYTHRVATTIDGVFMYIDGTRGIGTLTHNHPYIVIELEFKVYNLNVEFIDAPTGELASPENLRFEYRMSGGILNRPYVPNANRAIVWDPVPGAVAYMVYVFEDANETNPANAYRYQRVEKTEINIGHEDIQQARYAFKDWGFHAGTGANVPRGLHAISDNISTFDGPHVGPDGGLSWNAWQMSSRQGFDLPLPYKSFHFRVVAIPADEARNDESAPSDSIQAKPGARSVTPAQMRALVENARENGAGGDGFMFIEVGRRTLNYIVGTFDSTFIQFNWPTTSENSLFDGPASMTNRNFVDRAAIEIQNHPAYLGPDTVIFTT